MQPLSGVRIIDVTHALAGPFCTHHLQLMGAEVIKVEPPNGDDFRIRPAAFAACNAGKRSITIDLKTPAGRELLMSMIAKGDVLVENYRPGVAAEFGLEWEALRKVNPKLIFCSLTGYGQEGPLRDMPAIESSVQAASGLMMAQLGAGAHKRETNMLLLDPLTGYVAYAAIMAALLQRQQTGLGQRLDVAMIDAAMMISPADRHLEPADRRPRSAFRPQRHKASASGGPPDGRPLRRQGPGAVHRRGPAALVRPGLRCARPSGAEGGPALRHPAGAGRPRRRVDGRVGSGPG